MALLTIEGVGKEYRGRGKPVVALDGIDLNIAEGEFVTIVGPSGCGKSTLLRRPAPFMLLEQCCDQPFPLREDGTNSR